MPLTATEYKALIPVEVGDTGVVVSNMATLWAKHSTKPLDLQCRYGPLAAIRRLLAQPNARQAVTFHSASGAQLNQHEITQNLQAMLTDTLVQIKDYRSVGSRPAADVMSTTTIIPATPGYRDGSDSYYLGDPNARRARGSFGG